MSAPERLLGSAKSAQIETRDVSGAARPVCATKLPRVSVRNTLASHVVVAKDESNDDQRPPMDVLIDPGRVQSPPLALTSCDAGLAKANAPQP